MYREDAAEEDRKPDIAPGDRIVITNESTRSLWAESHRYATWRDRWFVGTSRWLGRTQRNLPAVGIRQSHLIRRGFPAPNTQYTNRAG
jgi:hypothetical protein